MFIRCKIVKGIPKRKVAKFENAAWARGYNAGVDAVNAEFHRRLQLLQKDGVETMTIQALATWYKGGK